MSDPILPGGEAGLRDELEEAAIAFAVETGCGLTIGGKRVLCDHPDAYQFEERPAECSCRQGIKVALAQLQSDRARLEAENAFLREVQEAVVARWREAALMAVNGDVRRLQRLLNASQARIVGSVVRELSDEEKAARAAALADAYHREKEARNGR